MLPISQHQLTPLEVSFNQNKKFIFTNEILVFSQSEHNKMISFVHHVMTRH
jgi:hypothetical protein